MNDFIIEISKELFYKDWIIPALLVAGVVFVEFKLWKSSLPRYIRIGCSVFIVSTAVSILIRLFLRHNAQTLIPYPKPVSAFLFFLAVFSAVLTIRHYVALNNDLKGLSKK